jgi:hypothetical protein
MREKDSRTIPVFAAPTSEYRMGFLVNASGLLKM